MYSSVWYDSLIKPFLQPPAWVFTPVWIILYGTILVSVVVYAITITNKKKFAGYLYFVIHMIFNLLWSPIFFYMHRIDIALGIIFVLLITAILFITRFYSISKLSGIMLFPYFFWLIFAAYLNLQFWRLN